MALLRETIFKPSPDYKAFLPSFWGGTLRGGSRLSSHGERNYRKLLEIQNTADLWLQASSSINFNEKWQTLKKLAWSKDDGLHQEFHVSCLTTHSLFGVKKEKMP